MKTTKQLKIAIIIDSYDNANNGTVVSTKRLVELLNKEHNVKVVTNGECFEDHVGLPRLNIPIINSRMEKSGFAFAKPDKKILHSVIQWADIIHIPFPTPLGRSAMKISNRLDKPVTTSFYVQPETILLNIRCFSKRLSELIYRSLITNFYNKSMKVICPSSFAAAELEKRGIRIETSIIPGILLPEFSPTFWQKTGKIKKHFTILSVGRHARDKNHDILIKAINLSRYREKINLIISGKGPLTGYLLKKARNLSTIPVIDFLPNRLLLKAYQESDLYVHTSRAELKSMAVMEAMACGLPPLIANSPLSAAPGYAINSLFLFKSDCPKDLAGQIDFWFEHRDELEAYRYRYAQHALKYRIETSHQKLEIFFRSTIAQHRLSKNFNRLQGKMEPADYRYRHT